MMKKKKPKQKPQTPTEPGIAGIMLCAILAEAVTVLVSSGRGDLWFVWAHLALQASFMIACLRAGKWDSDIIEKAARALIGKGPAGFLVPFIAVFWFLTLAAGGISARLQEEVSSDPVQIASLVVLVCGLLLIFDSVSNNDFFYCIAQLSKKQPFPVRGSYGLVRHPGGAGFLMAAVSMPLLFASLWAAIPAIASSCGVLALSIRKDRLMIERLGDYRRYAKKVAYRFIPGVW